ATPRPGASRPAGASITRWVPYVVGAAAFVVAVVVIAPYVVSRLSSNSTAATPTEPPRAQPSVPVRKPVGALSITSTPPGAQVLLDGKRRGVTPLEIGDVAPGRHEIALTSDAGSVHRTVTIAAGKTVTIDELIFSGWVVVYAPFEIEIAEGGRVLR